MTGLEKSGQNHFITTHYMKRLNESVTDCLIVNGRIVKMGTVTELMRIWKVSIKLSC